jgi:predicted Zn finger-like uncharacterized protein
MLVICSNCKAHLQLDESKLPPNAFKLRCPKCQSRIEIKSAAPSDNDTTGLTLSAEMTPPSGQASPFERPPIAAPFRPVNSDAEGADASATSPNDLVKLLAEVLRNADSGAPKSAALKRPAWSRRKALVCVDAERSAEIASGLVESEYEVFVAKSTAEALGRMREDRIDVVVLDGDFDPVEQGFAFVTREVNLMKPSERRRLFLVYLTPNAHTMDLHAAFLHNANLVVNPADLQRLPDALEVSLRYYNELYHDLNRVLELAPI